MPEGWRRRWGPRRPAGTSGWPRCGCGPALLGFGEEAAAGPSRAALRPVARGPPPSRGRDPAVSAGGRVGGAGGRRCARRTDLTPTAQGKVCHLRGSPSEGTAGGKRSAGSGVRVFHEAPCGVRRPWLPADSSAQPPLPVCKRAFGPRQFRERHIFSCQDVQTSTFSRFQARAVRESLHGASGGQTRRRAVTGLNRRGVLVSLLIAAQGPRTEGDGGTGCRSAAPRGDRAGEGSERHPDRGGETCRPAAGHSGGSSDGSSPRASGEGDGLRAAGVGPQRPCC